MQIICISRGSQSRGVEFAERLAAKLGYECVSREDLLEAATQAKIPIGRLETAIIKPHIFSERLALELEQYKALVTSTLCERALEKDIVYHGRTGNLLLPGVGHILKIRVVSDMEYRIQRVMTDLRLPRDKAKRYIVQIDDDRRRWVRRFYNVEWDVFTLYDMVLNLSQMSVDNAATAACSLAELPEFKATPAAVNTLRDLHLAAQARLLLGRDPRTNRAAIKIRSNNRVLHATYIGHEIRHPEVIVEVLQKLTNVRDIVCTEAATNILWIQEDFSKAQESYEQVMSVANAWDAAVEIIKMVPGDASEMVSTQADDTAVTSETWRETGIIAEGEDVGGKDPQDVANIYENLVKDGRVGGKRIIRGTQKTLLSAIDPSMRYRLIVFDNMFLEKGEAVRKRLSQEWSNLLADSLKSPVVNVCEIAIHYRFGIRQLLTMVGCAILTALLVFIALQYSEPILEFLSRDGLAARITSTAIICAIVPVFAFLYSNVTRLFLKMVKLD